MAKYYVTGVFKDAQDRLTHVMLHSFLNSVNGIDYFAKGAKTSVATVIQMIENLDVVTVLTWDYTGSTWTSGKQINVVNFVNTKFLRTTADKTVRDNLDNLINYTELV